MAGLNVYKQSLLLSNRKVQAREWMKYFEKHWEDLTIGLHDATILILAGRHGQEDGAIGDAEFKVIDTGERRNTLLYNHERMVSSFKFQYIPKIDLLNTHYTKSFNLDNE